ncbi:TadE family protein [Actinomarinicola tropica]|uniref:TadE family protein n=1 Tax=Actinomarinicola tropica TaxID=2789776 RepID=UPI00189A0264|nr:TadE family protein [Actinomarinicola tropica]
MRGRHRDDGGQAAVELALVLPLVCTLLLAVVQIGLIVHTHLLVVHAAREAVRAAAVDPRPSAPEAAVVGGTPLRADRVQVDVTDAGSGRVRVRVTYDMPTDVPLVGPLLGDVRVSADAVMRVEHDGAPP